MQPLLTSSAQAFPAQNHTTVCVCLCVCVSVCLSTYVCTRVQVQCSPLEAKIVFLVHVYRGVQFMSSQRI